jgi:hypothetical protein
MPGGGGGPCPSPGPGRGQWSRRAHRGGAVQHPFCRDISSPEIYYSVRKVVKCRREILRGIMKKIARPLLTRVDAPNRVGAASRPPRVDSGAPLSAVGTMGVEGEMVPRCDAAESLHRFTCFTTPLRKPPQTTSPSGVRAGLPPRTGIILQPRAAPWVRGPTNDLLALKGQENHLVPLQGESRMVRTDVPGRCPGLEHGAPSGRPDIQGGARGWKDTQGWTIVPLRGGRQTAPTRPPLLVQRGSGLPGVRECTKTRVFVHTLTAW